MDKSEEYRKMCDCPEIQGQRKFDDGDVVYLSAENPQEGRGDWICGEWENGSILHLKDGYFVSWDGAYNWDVIQEAHEDFVIWLPRQDQLQDILAIKPAYESDIGKLIGFNNYYGSFTLYPEANRYKYMETLDSMEQLWLAFVMAELHNKKWTGEAWEK